MSSKFSVTYANANRRNSPRAEGATGEVDSLRLNIRDNGVISFDKDAHRKMLAMLVNEVDRYHRTVTQRHVTCQGITPVSMKNAGLSSPTKKALLTDIDIVMNDDEKDNYQHALGAIASLALWQA